MSRSHASPRDLMHALLGRDPERRRYESAASSSTDAAADADFRAWLTANTVSSTDTTINSPNMQHRMRAFRDTYYVEAFAPSVY